jgi:hypothetical protein
VRLSNAQQLDDKEPAIAVSDAEIVVVGDKDSRFELVEETTGFYVIRNIVVDKTEVYRLIVITSNGKEFESDSSSHLMNCPTS